MIMYPSVYIKICLSIFLMLQGLVVSAQRKAMLIETSWAKTGIEIDGRLDDWKDSLDHFNPASGIFFSLANDQDHVYFALKTAEPGLLTKIIMSGISFSANTELDKKNPPKVLFPILDRTPGKPGSSRTMSTQEEMQAD